MVLGADVSRGAAAALGGMGQQQQPQQQGDTEAEAEAAAGLEFAAVIGSVDSHLVDYRQVVSAQVSGNRDVILGMRDSVAALLTQYAAAQAAQPKAGAGARVGAGAGTASSGPPPVPLPAAVLPEVLLVYRDGVSDSMFDTVLAVEHSAIKQACRDVGGPGYAPAVTLVVVQKRHNTRLFPASDKEGQAHRSGNVLPGTLVDQFVVDGAAFDFFLNSHAGIQGTNKAPRCSVVIH
ncbi:hypothetical protein GPECTOR_780g959 [Gonium pectorale]|uniref:Piwi domain-containing protein n=1 Tax=Gonium pectorale TaxID=33097 RepID=A0A150FU28_GONPE|nr:hypothetical protein GPECTOR_780g959 [Gonium pectorale]|eukprot:KXZ41112.1 hypothetical protein GPECTOR_780g959 [Gonium pectorale]